MACGVVIFAVAIPVAQSVHDSFVVRAPKVIDFTPLSFIKVFDLGLHEAVAAIRWVSLRSDMPLVPDGYEKLDYEIRLINSLDPRFSQPYYFSTIVLPEIQKHPYRVQAAVEVGKRGVRLSEPDWRVPFYLGAVNHVYLRDRGEAAKYFDLAAQTTGIPESIRRFSLGYGIAPKSRGEMKEIWLAIEAGANDKDTKKRAEMHIRHLEIIELLQDAVSTYREETGSFPSAVEDLVKEGFIAEVPKSPFGLNFFIYEGGLIGIKPLSSG